MIGTTLSHYRIVEELGRGGMGIVYKAEDAKLERTVALKVLPASALSSESDRARFYREAKSAAALNHPHIAQIYEIDEAIPEGGSAEEPRPFIAMEFIDGMPLDTRIEQGPMSLEEAVRLCIQIAQALEVAHEKNIVHRDIKAANVMLTAKGEAKVLDFGLAKTAHSTMLTRMGSTLGTVAYMSPEQARGEEVDGRTDLWALGIVLYQLIAGRLPFGGDYEQAVTYSILNEDPDPLTAIRTGVPMGLEWIVSKLLAKKADDRYQSAKDLIVDLRTVDLTQPGLSRSASVKSMPVATDDSANRKIRTFNIHPAIWVAIGALVAVSGWWIGSSSEPTVVSGSVQRITQSVPVGDIIATLDISDDGRYVAFGTEVIHVLDLSLDQIRTYDIVDVYVHLAFSPDSQQLLLTTATGVKILNLDSGAVIDVATTREGGPRAEWIDQDNIVLEELPSIYHRSLVTGETRQITFNDSLAGEYDMDYPTVVRKGRTVMATVQRRNDPDQLGFFDIESGERLAIIDLEGTRFQYVDPGYIVFSRGQSVLAVPFDMERLEVTGSVVSLAEEVRTEGMAVSREGSLVHAGQKVGTVSNVRPTRPFIIRMTGASFANEPIGQDFPAAVYRHAAVHPSGTMAAVVVEGELTGDRDIPDSDIWIINFQSGSRRAFTSDGISDSPAWNASGDSLIYIKRPQPNNRDVVRKALSGRGGDTILKQFGNTELGDFAVSPNGRWAMAAVGLPPTLDSYSDMILIDLSNTAETAFRVEDAMLIGSRNGNPRQFDFSPDSRYVAYEDQGAVFVRAIDDMDSPAHLIWENGKALPKWSADGTSIYAINVDGGGERMPVTLEGGFSVSGAAEDLTAYWYAFGTGFFDAFPESDRFLLGYPAPDVESPAEIDADSDQIEAHFILNLPAQFRDNQ